MNKLKYIYIFIIISILSIFVGCSKSSTTNKEILSVTIEPQRFFLEKLVGGAFEVNCVVPAGVNPESFDAAPSQLIVLEKSIAYFKVGNLGIENTLIAKVSENKPQMLVVDCSQGIDRSKYGTHEHLHSDDSDEHNCHAGGDPHIWSSPATAKIIVDNMYRSLLKMDVKNEAQYTSNYNQLVAEFNQTDSIIKQYLNNIPSKSFIIYHPSLSFFADEYGLNQLTIERDGKQPSPQQMKELIDHAKAAGVKVVFIQQEFDTKNAETIAREIGAKIFTINQMYYDWSAEMIKTARNLALEE